MNETCGCCEGVEPLTPLTAANRPGLNALSYRAGTHAAFLETMKARLSGYPALAGLTTRTANDPAIALLDAWATVADVLTFYQERIANEGYLHTATERNSILELARLVGYAPRPGVAASVYLAFTLESAPEDGSNVGSSAGTFTLAGAPKGNSDVEVPVGTRAQSVPGPGELPQSFETAEKLVARGAWNILKPRRSRSQSARQYARTKRLYLKGITTNLQPNAPLLIDFGLHQTYLRAQDVVADPAADRTLVTLQSPVASAVSGELADEIRRMVEHYLDLQAHGLDAGVMTRRVSRILRELRASVEHGELPGRLFASLREMLPRLRQHHATAVELQYRLLEPWIGGIVERFEDIQERLRVGSDPIAALALETTTAPAEPPAGDGRSPLERLEERLGPLARPPSRPPSSPQELLRNLEQSFDSTSDAVPRLLAALRPQLREAALYRAWEQAGTQPGTARVYALRDTTRPFGNNAPLIPILDEDGAIVDYEEWTLQRVRKLPEERFDISVMVRHTVRQEPDPRPSATVRTTTIQIETRLHPHPSVTEGPRPLRNERFSIDYRAAGETISATVSEVERDRFRLKLDFENRQTVVEVSNQEEDRPVINAPASPPDGSEPATEIAVAIVDDEFEVTSRGSDPTEVEVARSLSEENGSVSETEIKVAGTIQRRSTQATEQENVVSLEAPFNRILPGSWAVVERTDGTEPVIARVTGTGEGSRADYGMAARGTQLTLSESWIHPADDDFAVIRGTSLQVRSELLELAEAPFEEIDEKGALRVEPVGGKQIELDALYDGLEPGRWLIVAGEREDLPGVTASELVMLAGVAQGVQQVEPTISGRGSTGPGGYDLTVSAHLLPDGSATGHAHLVGGATGHVVQAVPPSGTRDFWCINVKRTDTDPNSGDQRINWYIRDIGDGITSFDEIAFVSGIGVDCVNNPAPPPRGAWIPLTKGDFKVTTDLPGDKVHSTLILANDLAYSYKRETVEIYGNVARATHGETRAEVLGSGDGSQALQRFLLKQSPLTFVAATTPTGTESTLEVYVDDVRRHEAERPTEPGPTDRRFVTQTDDQGQVTVVFGDGKRGARLPTGMENVRAEYRTGIGKAGNVAEKQISLLATTLPLGLKGVTNPLPATGGADRDTPDQARRNAPLAVMALDRLVSVRDYEDFARTFAGIGKASAVRLSGGDRQLVHVTIAGDDDIPIAKDSDLYRNLDQALRRFGDPYQPLRVEVRERILLIISAGVRVLPDYRWESVEPEIRAALLDTFSFERRELGQDALLSEVIGAIQRVPGVAYVDVDTFGPLPEKTTIGADVRLTEIPGKIQELAAEGRPRPRVVAQPARPREGVIRPAQLAFLTPRVPDTLILRKVDR